MQYCSLCQEKMTNPSTLELFCDNEPIYELKICKDCKQELLSGEVGHDFLFADDYDEDVDEPNYVGHKIVTQEQLMDILSGKLDPKELPDAEDFEPCEECGQTQEDIAETGQLGCPNCYNHFKDLIHEFIESFQDSKQHIGKQPETQLSKEEQIKYLKLKLAHAKEHGNFQNAAKFYNELKDLEG